MVRLRTELQRWTASAIPPSRVRTGTESLHAVTYPHLDGHKLLDEELPIVLLALELAFQPRVFSAEPLVHPVEAVRHLLGPVQLGLRSPCPFDPSAVAAILPALFSL